MSILTSIATTIAMNAANGAGGSLTDALKRKFGRRRGNAAITNRAEIMADDVPEVTNDLIAMIAASEVGEMGRGDAKRYLFVAQCATSGDNYRFEATAAQRNYVRTKQKAGVKMFRFTVRPDEVKVKALRSK